MVKNFSEFSKACEDKRELFFKIPAEYLTEEGREVRDMYKALYNTCLFADSASEMLELIGADPAYMIYSNRCANEYRLVRSCLERLAKLE